MTLTEKQINQLIECLAFYARPETYFAMGWFPDPPCGELITDFSETELGEKPGKRARALLTKLDKGVNG